MEVGPMSEEIMVCPACDSPMIQVNVQTNIQGTGAATAYRCRNCPATFDEPATRERRAIGGRSGLAGTLADEDTELALDGGHRLDDPAGPDPGDPAQWCRECGRERAGMCACCGSPLCPEHLELGAGTCSAHVTIDTRVGPVPACIRTLAGEREICVDAPTFNHARPQRARLPPDEIERAVRERLPDALIERAAAATTDARARLDDSIDPAVIETLLAADDALRFALAADQADRRDGWLDRAVVGLANCLAGLDDAQAALAMDLTTATATLEQLGIAADTGGETDE